MQPLTLSPLELTDQNCTKLSFGSFMSFLPIFLRDIRWELYNIDCKRAADVLRKQPYVHRITGLFSFLFSPVLAVEIDMPWMSGLEDKYGESFRPWTEEDLLQALGNVVAALPHNRLATIVRHFFFCLTS